ncbi:hypothetical protein AB0H71_06805 [Nocardia sp. NPDC050697]|uniref:TY-Chap domain-containing protein n=1 Tax=Nocardia sp. NPDC050697 TaxID=3155158 RepID=UPI0033DB5412
MTTTDRDAWQRLSEALALTLTWLPEGGFLVIGATGNRFIRFQMRPRWLWCEITHNDQLGDDRYRMSADAEQMLDDQGWYLPPESVSVNWFKHVNWPAHYREYRTIAHECVRALHEFLGVGTPSELTVKAWTSSSEEEFNTDLVTGAVR